VSYRAAGYNMARTQALKVTPGDPEGPLAADCRCIPLPCACTPPCASTEGGGAQGCLRRGGVAGGGGCVGSPSAGLPRIHSPPLGPLGRLLAMRHWQEASIRGEAAIFDPFFWLEFF